MTELDPVYEAVERENAGESAATRRQLVAGAGGVVAGMGLLGLIPGIAEAAHSTNPQTVLNIAATAEVLATIVNTVGPEKVGLDATTKRNIDAAAREELIHFEVLTSSGVGGKELTRKIHVPDEVFSSREALLKTLVAGDQIFINAYMIGVTTFGNAGNGRLARVASEFMGTEAVHRALALQSLGQLGNDRAFMKYSQPEENPNDPFFRKAGFRRIESAVTYLETAGFGFGKPGSKPGQMYDFDDVRKRTPDPQEVNTRTPR